MGVHTIGRHGCVIQVDDKSVSRVHAEISIEPVAKNSPVPPENISVIDKSRFGTMVNGIKLSKDVKTPLHADDVLQFGVNKDRYRLSFTKILFLWNPSSLNLETDEVAQIEQWIAALGVQFSTTYKTEPDKKATHVLMKEIDECSWEEVLLALIEEIPIISPLWLQSILNRPTLTTDLPNCEDFLPPFAERFSFGNSFDLKSEMKRTDKRRKEMFKDFVFVIPKEDGKSGVHISDLIMASGGKIVKSSGKVTPNRNRRERVLFVEYGTEEKGSGERVGVEQIRNAMLYGDVDKYLPPQLSGVASDHEGSVIPEIALNKKIVQVVEIEDSDDEEQMRQPVTLKQEEKLPNASDRTLEKETEKKEQAAGNTTLGTSAKMETESTTTTTVSEQNSKSRKRKLEEEVMQSDVTANGNGKPEEGSSPEKKRQRLETEEDLGGMQTLHTKLLARPITPEVKNRKIFKQKVRPPKSPEETVKCLPFDTTSTKERDEWLREAEDEDKQRRLEEKKADELFNTTVPGGSRGRGRRRK